MAVPIANGFGEAAGGFGFQRRSLSNVTIVALTDEALPDGANKWPVHVVRVGEWNHKAESHFVYIVGKHEQVQQNMLHEPWLESGTSNFNDCRVLGFVTDALSPGLRSLRPNDIVPSLSEGFSSETWEKVVSAVCNRHIDTIPDMVRSQALLSPDRVALIFQGQELTYRELVSAACSFVDHLESEHIVCAGGAVAVYLLPSAFAVIAYLGLLWGGYTANCVEPNSACLAWKLETFRTQAVVCLHSNQPAVEPSMKLILIDQVELTMDKPIASLPASIAKLNDVSFVAWTSGSTGKPKGVATLHERIAPWVRWRQFFFPLGVEDRVAHSLFFAWYWHLPLCQGVTMVVTPHELNFDVTALLTCFDHQQVTMADCLTPGLISVLLDVIDGDLPASLRTVVCGGEALPLATCQRWLRRWPRVKLINNFAMTETAADISMLHITPAILNVDMTHAPAIGPCIAWQNLVTVVDGELVLQGKNVADGYLPPASSHCFRIVAGGHNEFRTGDRAEIIGDTIQLIGRKDSVVKVRGFRVDLDGVQAALADCEVLSDVAIVATSERIHGIVVTRDLEEVRRFAEAKIEHASLITWKTVQSLPYSQSGKRDRRALLDAIRAEEVKEASTETVVLADAGDFVRRVTEAWTSVLGRNVGRGEQFMEVGGNSLAAMRIAKLLGVPPTFLFSYPTIAELSAQLEREEAGKDSSSCKEENAARDTKTSNYPRKLRILCLHGWRMNPEMMKLMMAPLSHALAGVAEFFYAAGLIATEDACSSEALGTFSQPFYEWWGRDSDASGEEMAAKHVAEIVGKLGGVDAVLGFSQGATVATLLAELLQRGNGAPADGGITVVPLRLVVCVCGALPASPCVRRLSLESIHAIGEKDDENKSGQALMAEWFGSAKYPALFFRHPGGHHFPRDVAPLADAIRAVLEPETATRPSDTATRSEIAIVGMAGRFPGGACSVSALWDALEHGEDLLSDAPGGTAPGRVPRKGIVSDKGCDCAFWGLAREQATQLDTAQRVLLEVAYEALEDAGIDPTRAPGRVGVAVSGGSLSHYASEVLGVDLDDCRTERPDEYFALEIGTDKDYLATQIAYRLDFQGPAEVVQTACSSSLVAVVRAVQMLRLGLCEFVVCGGASFSPDSAVRSVDGMIWSPDGMCRPFADGASGTVNADGCGLVVLTRLGNARTHGRRVYATIRGVGVNNDGARKSGFSAPSHAGQVEVIRMALSDAIVQGDDIDYVECHGTGTKLGDPIELQALSEALSATPSARRGRRASAVPVGSVKGNLGHMNTAAAMPGLIKTALMLFHRRMVPSRYADKPTTIIDWAKLGLRLASESEPWKGTLACISSFGIGGTNAHAVLSAVAPEIPEDLASAVPMEGKVILPPAKERTARLFVASARTLPALQEMRERLGTVAPRASEIDEAARIEATLLSRRRFPHRCFTRRLDNMTTSRTTVSARRQAVLLFPGQGSAYPGMGAELESVGLLQRDWASGVAAGDVVRASLAVAAALEQQGLTVCAVAGHSVGEWAAAAFAGAIPIDQAIRLADLRGRLMERMEPGIMISVRAEPNILRDLAGPGVEVACQNGFETTVLAGPCEAIEILEEQLRKRDIAFRRLETTRAFHTRAVDPILDEYSEALRSVSFGKLRLPLLSNLSGGWHEEGSAAVNTRVGAVVAAVSTPEYWADHLRQPVRFDLNLQQLAERFRECVIVEVGPATLAGLVTREAPRLGADWQVARTLRQNEEVESYIDCLGLLWAHADLQPNLPPPAGRHVTSLPGYAFQREVVATNTRGALTGTSFRAPPRKPVRQRNVHGNVVTNKDDIASVEGSNRFFYELCLEKVRVSSLEPAKAAAVLLGDRGDGASGAFTDAGFPPHILWATAEQAAVAARSVGGVLLCIVNPAKEARFDGSYLETLLVEIRDLLSVLSRVRADGLEIFFVLPTSHYCGFPRGRLQPTVAAADMSAISEAAFAFLRVASREHPELRLRRLLWEEGANLVLPALPAELVVRSDGTYALRLREAPAPLPLSPKLACARTKYAKALVTGGLRGLGTRVAEWLLSSGRAESLVLVGRRPPEGVEIEILDRLQSKASVEVCLCDVSDRVEVQEKLPTDCDLVIHCAGNVKDGLLLHAQSADLRRVLDPKVQGTLNLLECLPRARFLGFSSSSGPFGPAGQASYAAANAFIDALVPSVQWGGWGEVGMAKDLDIAPSPGERFISVIDGLRCLGQILDACAANLNDSGEHPSEAIPPRWCVLDVDWAQFRQNHTLFVPEEPLLADIGKEFSSNTADLSTGALGVSITIGDRARGWEVVVGPSGSRFRGSSLAWEVCQQHVVDGVPIMPGSGFVSLALAVCREIGLASATLSDVQFLRPLELASPRRLTTALALDGSGNSGSIRFTSCAMRDADGEVEQGDGGDASGTGNTEVLHCTCRVDGSSVIAAVPLETILPVQEADVFEGAELYFAFAKAGYFYGPDFQLARASRDKVTARAEGCLPQQEQSDTFVIHPATLDAAFQLASMLHPLGNRGAPRAIRRVVCTLRSPFATNAGSNTATSGLSPPKVARATCGKGDNSTEVTLQLLGDRREVLFHVEGLELASLQAFPLQKLKRLSWQPAEPQQLAHGTCLFVGEAPQGCSEGLHGFAGCSQERHGAEAFSVRAETLEDVRACRDEAQQRAARLRCYVLVQDSTRAGAAAAAAAEVGACAILLGCGDVDEALRSAAKSLGLRLGSSQGESGVGVAADNAGSGRILRVAEGQAVEVPHWDAGNPNDTGRSVDEASPEEAFVATVDPARGLQGVHCRRVERRSPGVGEVEVKASHWALNFRDAMVAVGAIPPEVAGKSLGIGGECYGEVTRVGEGVKDLHPGDRVIAVPPDGMGSFAVMDSRWVAPAPQGLTPEEAVAGTCVYATAWLALHWMARMIPGESVLIHSAAGGVGLAAVHLCLRAGCTVYVTASSEEKRTLLLSLGVVAAFNSRDVNDFERGVLAATGGVGVDIVLNSLKGEAILASLRILKPFGRLLELGKRDQYEDTAIGLRPFLGGLTYAAAHLDVLMLKLPDRARRLLEEVWLELPDLPRLPTRCFDMANLPSSLEYLSKGQHIGKVLVNIGPATPVLALHPRAVIGPSEDHVAAALRIAWNATASAEVCGIVACIPSLDCISSEDELRRAIAVVTASPAVSALATAVCCPGTHILELPRWEPPSLPLLEQWLAGPGGHYRAAEEEETGGSLPEWLLGAIADMASAIGLDDTFDSVGIDSLGLISLARRISTKIGKAVSVVDLYDNPTPSKLLRVLSGGARQGHQLSTSRGRILCLHGFRSSKEAMEMALAPYVSVCSDFEWVFVNSPRRASGPADPKLLSDMDAFEWWGQPDGPFETGWMAPHFDGLEETLASLAGLKPLGVVGFSQGGAMAALLASAAAEGLAWVALFSAVMPSNLGPCDLPSFHSYCPEETYAAQSVEVADSFNASNRVIHLHLADHAVPSDESSVKAFVEFISQLNS